MLERMRACVPLTPATTPDLRLIPSNAIASLSSDYCSSNICSSRRFSSPAILRHEPHRQQLCTCTLHQGFDSSCLGFCFLFVAYERQGVEFRAPGGEGKVHEHASSPRCVFVGNFVLPVGRHRGMLYCFCNRSSRRLGACIHRHHSFFYLMYYPNARSFSPGNYCSYEAAFMTANCHKLICISACARRGKFSVRDGSSDWRPHWKDDFESKH